ncbi:NtaA/DmoA family FMN-dependent monooxygenase [Leucobacter massiliensis]|uniref:F420-dependent methylene-tetrahydromethanopterin reductase n=1 Tax=Leucobacter massiliensis TaxID=1686285 RepID=A0A2S9QKN7_9MICO|nr:NtaA/DmoA family FMN-dependent monooxygenase [Leucobacter massiliensis]PRI10142.1 F420-dependent methylene-tetrahydromethanopterin reductase [Leucobacter massiliensis]
MSTTPEPKRQARLVAHFPGVNSTTVWRDPEAGSQIDFASFRHFARTAERGLFDYIFFAEGLRVREHGGRFHELDVAGRPATLTILAALASVTERIGLVGTLSSTFNEPVELARRLATIDHLSGGRVGWNVVTSPDAFHGANFRRGGFLDYGDRYLRAEEFVRIAKELWDSWEPGAVVADAEHGVFADPDRVHPVVHHGPQFDIAATSTVPRSPQGYPVIVQAGDSPAGRDFAAANAEVIFSRHTGFEDGRRFYADVKGRLGAAGRSEESLLILPGATFVLGDTAAEAAERSREIARQQISPQTAIAWVEAIWGRAIPGLDPDGPLPAEDPGDGEQRQGQVSTQVADRIARARELRQRAEAEGLTLRELVIAETAQHTFVGTPAHVAAEIDRHVQQRASDGFVLVPHLTPSGLDEFVDRVVPLLQERGVYRSEYPVDPATGTTTLRTTLGLPEPSRPAAPRSRGEETPRNGGRAGRQDPEQQSRHAQYPQHAQLPQHQRQEGAAA